MTGDIEMKLTEKEALKRIETADDLALRDAKQFRLELHAVLTKYGIVDEYLQAKRGLEILSILERMMTEA